MNKTNYKQYDTRWASLPYPKKPYTIKGCGCGEVAICNTIIEMQKYASQTPKTIQPYCKQYAAPNGNGTYFSGIPAMMKHYGMTEVKEHDTMPALFKELAKGNRVAILLMGNRLGGSKKIRWTTGAHFVAATGYKKQNGKDYLYIKDSNSTLASRNGWLAYTENLKGDVSRVWSGKLNGTLYKEPTTTTTTPTTSTPYTPTTPYTGSLPSGTVKSGSKGNDAKAVQTFLNWCINAKLDTDGIIGAKSVAAIKKFQSQYKLDADGIFGAKSLAKAKEIVNAHKPKETPKPTTSTTPTKAQQINERALDYAWAVGTPEKVYKYPSGSPNAAFKAAWKKYFPKRKINCGCHQYVMLVLKACGYPTMPLEWKNILTYMRKNFKELKVNYTQSQLQPGDIRIHKNSSGGYHIWIIVKQNGKFYRAEANQTGNKRYAHINTSNKGNTTKHKADWLFRAK